MEPASPSAGADEQSPPGLLLGVGNVFCGDDGIGPAVAERVYELLADPARWTVDTACCSTLGIIERMEGRQMAVVVDSLLDGDMEPGTVLPIELEEAARTPHTSFHTLGLGEALALGRAIGLPLPRLILVYGIAIRGPLVFGQGLSPQLAAGLDSIARHIAEDLAGRLAESGRQTVGPPALG